jgi:hypothetical protein
MSSVYIHVSTALTLLREATPTGTTVGIHDLAGRGGRPTAIAVGIDPRAELWWPARPTAKRSAHVHV